MSYHFNKYLLASADKTGNIIIYNTLTYETFCVLKKDADIFYEIRRQIIDTGKYSGDYENVKALENAGIVLKNDVLINNLLQQRWTEVFDSRKSFTLIILPTEKCNFRCEYCYENHDGVTMTDRTGLSSGNNKDEC